MVIAGLYQTSSEPPTLLKSASTAPLVLSIMTDRPGFPHPASSWFPGPSAAPFGPQSFNPYIAVTVIPTGSITATAPPGLALVAGTDR